MLSVPFRYEASEDARKILEDFRDMVNFCIRRALETGVTSFARLRNLIYEEFRAKWPNYTSHYCHSAVRVATSMLKAWRNRCRRGQADPDRPPRARKLFMRLDDHVAKFKGDKVVITTAPRRYIELRLMVGGYQRKFIEAWERGELKIGEIIVNERYVLAPFRKTVDLAKPDEWIALDMNETNVTGVSTNPDILRWNLSELRRIYWTYHEIRRRIQAIKGPRRARLLEKYSRRLRNRTKDLLHKVSKVIVETAEELKTGVIMEDLRGIKRKNRGKSLNRRLHGFWPVRRLQSYIEYKAKLAGLPVSYVNPKGTSTRCPICGSRLVPNRHRELRCPRCGLKGDRDVIACLNLLRMWGAPVPPERFPMTLKEREELLPQTHLDTTPNGMKQQERTVN